MSELLNMFQQYRDCKIAIYGLGTETERILTEIDREMQIVGLLDSYKEEGELYNKSIISIEEAIAEGVKLILVVARPGSCKAIEKRIGAVCRKNRIALFDVRGKDLCDRKSVTYDFSAVNGITKQQLSQLVEENEVISIDLFDTLVMRQILFPTDIFELVDRRLSEQGIIIKDFCKRRLESEKYLSKFTAPTLVEIYAYMLDTYAIEKGSPEEMAKLEWSIDCTLLVPRQEMCDFISQIYSQGKNVYIVTDTYYTKKQIEQILEKCKIACYTEIFVSCEYKTGKTGRLFEIVKEKISGEKRLHIGDDIVADIENAKKQGITACQIYSGLELLEQVGYLGLWDNTDELSDRIKIGMFVSRIFNSPFQFETQERKIEVRSAYDIGYLFMAPMIVDFVIWFREQVEENKLKNIWFCARDGYLIKKLYERLTGEMGTVYFLTSRTAAIRAGVQSKKDIKYVEKMKFSGSVKLQLQRRFGIEKGIEEEDVGTGQEDLLRYNGQILKKAAEAKERYLQYINKLPMTEGKIAFFDFVAKGTSQMFISHIVPNHLMGLYFLQLEKENMKGAGLDIVSFYDTDDLKDSVIYEDYYILEPVLTSPDPSVEDFDDVGKPCYAEEKRTEKEILCFSQVQKGIQEYFNTYLKVCPVIERVINKKLNERFLALIHEVALQGSEFIKLQVEDSFYNRMTKIEDLV